MATDPLTAREADGNKGSTPSGIGDVAQMASTSRDPAIALPAVAALRRLVEDLEAIHVDNARDSGWSWRAIADALGVTKQTVHRKHRRR